MNITGTKKAIKWAREAGVTLILHGVYACGKSSAVRQVSDELFDPDGTKDRDSYLAEFSGNTALPEDFTGTAFPNEERTKMTYLNSELLPDLNDDFWNDEGIVLLDEITDAPNSIQKMMYELLLDGRLKRYRLPKGWSVVGAGNRQKDGSGSHMMPAPAITRCCHIGVCSKVPDFSRKLNSDDAEIDIEESTQHWHSINMNPMVIAYIRLRPQHAHDGQATPRTWEMVSDLMAVVDDHTDPVFIEMVCGLVGPVIGSEFCSSIRMFSTIPSIDAIKVDPDSVEVPEDMGVLHALSNALIYHVDFDNAANLIKYTLRLPREFQVYVMKSMINKDDAIGKLPEYIQWLNDNRDIMF